MLGSWELGVESMRKDEDATGRQRCLHGRVGMTVEVPLLELGPGLGL